MNLKIVLDKIYRIFKERNISGCDFLDDMNEKLHTHHKHTLVYVQRNLYHSEGTGLQLNI